MSNLIPEGGVPFGDLGNINQPDDSQPVPPGDPSSDLVVTPDVSSPPGNFNALVGTVVSLPSVVTPSFSSMSQFQSGPPIWNAQPYLQVNANGVTMPNVTGVQISMGFDIAVATAAVVLTEDPLVPNNTEIVIVCGAGPHNEQRFRGLVKRTRANLWPHSFTLVCQGMLSRAAEYRQSKGVGLPSFISSALPVVGMSIFDLLGMTVDVSDSDAVSSALPNLSCTDQNYVKAVLQQVPNLDFDPADIGGTDHVFGTLAWRNLTWAPYVRALAQCQKLDEVCLGFRLFESLNGRIKREQVYGYPNSTSDLTFTEGIDVLTAFGGQSIEDLVNGEYVEGFALGGIAGLINAYSVESNDFQSSDNPVVDTFSSPLIEDSDFAAQVRDWRLTERNRAVVDVQWTTHRDDLMFPGQTIAINLPHASVTQPVWCQHVDISVKKDPVMFRQVGTGIGGGIPGDNPSPQAY